ncbi:MAG: SAM-dependent methyltransferase [Paracoccaceae bacterium]
MPSPAPLTDRAALARNRARSRPGALFLHQAARDEVEDRISIVNRQFTRPAIITGHPDFWRDLLPDAVVVPDDEVLALVPGAHDLVIHAMALHWANDPVGQLVQARRALAADGLFLGVSLGGQSLQELRATLAQAEVALTGGLSPRVLPMAEIRDLGGLLQRAGFALPVADSLTLTATYSGTLDLMHDLRAMGEGNALAARHRMPPPRALFARADALYHATYGLPDGRIPATFDLITLTGWAPDASQPQPLRPGSAQARLADALGTSEAPLDE